MKRHLNIAANTVRLVAGTYLVLVCLLGSASRLHAQPNWDFEGGNTHGFTLRTVKPATAAPDDPTTAGDESLTGVGGPNGLPGAGLAWTIGSPAQFNGLKPAVVEGSHIDINGLLEYSLNGQPIPPGLNTRGQTNYLNTYNLNQWGDGLNRSNNDQIARSPNVVVQPNAVLLVWHYGGGTGTHAPVDDFTPGEGYDDNSSGVAVRRASDDSLLASALTDGRGTLKAAWVDLKAFAGQTVYIELVDAFEGSFGWLALDEIQFTSNSITLAPGAFTFEAEDFNYDGGQYIDNPNLTLLDPNCYYKKGSSLGVQGTDFNELNPNVHFGIDSVEWRFDGFNAYANLPQTTNSFDAVRSQYTTAGVADCDMANNAADEWWNYTRTFPNTNGYLYARVAADGPFSIRVDMVSNPTVSNQTLISRGWFIGTGATKGLYQTVPLTDITGTNQLVVAFDGTPKTLRMTALSSGYIANFYVVDPTTDPERFFPTLSITEPATFTVLPSGVPVTNTVTILDADSPAGSHTVKFYARDVELGEVTSPPYTLVANLSDGPYTLTARAIDPDGLVGISQSVLVNVGPEPYLYRETYTIADGLTGDKSPNAFGWQPFGANGNVRTDNWVNYAASNKTVNAVNTLSAGPHFDGTFNLAGNPSSHGIQFVAGETTALTFTPEFSFNPADYDNKVKFSWEQGNRLTGAACQLIIRVGATWYAHYQTFTNSVEVNPINSFGTIAELKEVLYDPNPTNWFLLNFNGTYDHVTKVAGSSTLGAATLGGNPAQPLSGTITAFGLYCVDPSNQNRRFDTFTIEELPADPLVITSTSLSGNQLTLNWSGGTGPYTVRKKTLITDAWSDEQAGIAGNSTTVTISLDGGISGYYQVVGQ